MQLLRRFLVFVCLIVLFLVGVHGFFISLPWEWIAKYPRAISDQISTWTRVVAYLVMLALPVLVAIMSISLARAETKIVSRRKDGTIIISEAAIVKCIRNAVSGIPAVLDIRPAITNTGRGVVVRAHAQVRVGEELPAINRRIKERIQLTLTRVLGIEHVADIQVIIEDVKLGEKMRREEIYQTGVRTDEEVAGPESAEKERE
jgi:uncharacterized alkaline shock family protein YloU